MTENNQDIIDSIKLELGFPPEDFERFARKLGWTPDQIEYISEFIYELSQNNPEKARLNFDKVKSILSKLKEPNCDVVNVLNKYHIIFCEVDPYGKTLPEIIEAFVRYGIESKDLKIIFGEDAAFFNFLVVIYKNGSMYYS